MKFQFSTALEWINYYKESRNNTVEKLKCAFALTSVISYVGLVVPSYQQTTVLVCIFINLMTEASSNNP